MRKMNSSWAGKGGRACLRRKAVLLGGQLVIAPCIFSPYIFLPDGGTHPRASQFGSMKKKIKKSINTSGSPFPPPTRGLCCPGYGKEQALGWSPSLLLSLPEQSSLRTPCKGQVRSRSEAGWFLANTVELWLLLS